MREIEQDIEEARSLRRGLQAGAPDWTLVQQELNGLREDKRPLQLILGNGSNNILITPKGNVWFVDLGNAVVNADAGKMQQEKVEPERLMDEYGLTQRGQEGS